MKVTLTVLVIGTLGLVAGGTTYADCTLPDGGSITIPSGASATREEMVATQKALKAYDTAIRAYSDCLQDELAKKIATGGDKAKLGEEYSRRSNEEVDKMQRLADKFNTELHAFKDKNAG